MMFALTITVELQIRPKISSAYLNSRGNPHESGSRRQIYAGNTRHRSLHRCAALPGARQRENVGFPGATERLTRFHEPDVGSRSVSIDRRRVAGNRSFNPARCVHPVGQHGGRLLHGPRAKEFLSASQRRRRRNPLLLLGPAVFRCRTPPPGPPPFGDARFLPTSAPPLTPPSCPSPRRPR